MYSNSHVYTYRYATFHVTVLILFLIFCKADSGPCCPPDISVGFNWPTAPIGITIQQKCNNIHSNFQPFSSARRTCLSGGAWGPVDISGCTVLSSNSATTAAVVVANVTASRVEVGANSSVLVSQVSVPFNSSIFVEYIVYILEHNHESFSLFQSCGSATYMYR